MKNLLTILALISSMMLHADFKERVQLITDKNTYLAGEDVLVAFITTDENLKPVTFSRVGYIELADSTESLSQVMFSINNGCGSGIISIPEDLPTGYYRLCAYTRFMRTESPAVQTEQLISIVNARTLHHSQLKTTDPTNLVTPELPDTTYLSTDKQEYGLRQTGKITVRNLPSDLAIYHLSVAAHFPGTTPAPQITRTNKSLQLSKGAFPAEYEGHIIRARINGDLPGNVPVLLSVPGNQPGLVAGKRISENEYEFISNFITGKTDLASSINTPDNERYSLDFLTPFAGVDFLPTPAFLPDSNYLQDIQKRYIALQAKENFQPQLYKPVTLSQSILYTPDWIYKLEEFTRFNTIEEVILEYVSNVRFRKVGNKRTLAVNREGPDGYTIGNTLVLLDNVPVFNHDLLLQYNAALIERIEIYRGQFVFSGQLYDGIVTFNTYEKDFRGFQLDTSTLISTYTGPQNNWILADIPELSPSERAHTPDLRTTLVWENKNTSNGSIKYETHFTTSDVSGTYRVQLWGLTRSGKPISSSTNIEIK